MFGQGVLTTESAWRNPGRGSRASVEYNGQNPGRPELQQIRQRLVVGDDGLRRIVWDLVPVPGLEHDLPGRDENAWNSRFYRMVPLGDTKNASCLWGRELRDEFVRDVLVLPGSDGQTYVWHRILDAATGEILAEQTYLDRYDAEVRTTVAEDDVRPCCHGLTGHCEQTAPRPEKVYVRPPAKPKKKTRRTATASARSSSVRLNGEVWRG